MEKTTSKKLMRTAEWLIIACALVVMVTELVNHNFTAAIWAFNTALWVGVSIAQEEVIKHQDETIDDLTKFADELGNKLAEERKKNNK